MILTKAEEAEKQKYLEYMRKIAFNYTRMKDEKDAPDNETWEAKVLRRKLTAEKVNKAIGYEQGNIVN